MPKSARSKPEIAVKRVGDHEWRFGFPRLTGEVYAEFDAAVDLLHGGDLRKAIAAFRRLVNRFPEFIDARHHLAIAHQALEPEFSPEATHEWAVAVDTGLGALPPEFTLGRDLLEWGWLENRPFLRAYHGYALDTLEHGFPGEAMAVFQDLLDMNPGDNQGVRGLLVHTYLDRRRPQEALRLCEAYPQDGMASMLYGRVLALLTLARRDDATEALEDAIRISPLVAKELAKKTHRVPRGLEPGYVTLGGADEAYYYWSEAGELWKRTRGALEFVRKSLGK